MGYRNRRVITERLWERRQVPGQGVVELRNLRDLITSKPRKGWGEDPAKIEAVIRDDAEVLAMWREAMKPEQGRNQHSSDDNVNAATSTPKGNSRSYTLSRLQRESPELFEQVKAKKISAHAAAIKAGFRKAMVSVEPTVERPFVPVIFAA